jgi:IS5 family transposase
MQPCKRRLLSDSAPSEMIEKVEKIKTSITAKVKHPFHVNKNLFRHKKTRCLGLAKNHALLYNPFGLALNCQDVVC